MHPFSRNGAPQRTVCYSICTKGLLHRAPHFHFINIHSQESKIRNSQDDKTAAIGLFASKDIASVPNLALILEAEFSLFRAGEPMSSSSFTWCFLQSRNKVKSSEGVFTASICVVKFFSNCNGWKVGRLFKYRELSDGFYGPMSSVSFDLMNWSDKWPPELASIHSSLNWKGDSSSNALRQRNAALLVASSLSLSKNQGPT